MIEVRKFATAQECLQACADVRRRLWSPANAVIEQDRPQKAVRRDPDEIGEIVRDVLTSPAGKPRIVEVEDDPKKKPVPIVVSYRDLIQKDAHVTAFRLYEAARDCKAQAYLKARSSELGFPVEEITGKSRTRGIVRPRQVIVWEIKRNIKPWISFPELGRMFGSRDHTTMLHSINMIDRLIASGEMIVGEDGKIIMDHRA